MTITKSTTCTVTKKKLLVNKNNKKELINLLSDVFHEHRITVFRATDDADTMIVSKALNQSLVGDVEVKAEDTDILCLLVHHFNPEYHNNIILTTKWGIFSISEIVRQLDPKEREILLLIHSFSGCDTVSSLFGFGKEKLLKNGVAFNESHDLDPLISIRSSKADIIKAGLLFMQYIYGDKNKSLDSLRFFSYNRIVAKKSLNFKPW